MRTSLRILAGVLFLTGIAVCMGFVYSAPRVQQDNEPVRVRVEEQAVVVDARLPNGDSIDGLTARDFVIKQNGSLRPVRRVEAQRHNIPREGPIALALVLCNKGCLGLDLLKQAASRLISLLKPHDVAALYVTCPETRQIAGFTDDMKTLQQALSDVALLTGCNPKLQEVVPLPANDVVAATQARVDHKRIVGMISGDDMPFGYKTIPNPDPDPNADFDDSTTQIMQFDGPEFDALVNLLRTNETKFVSISRNKRPQEDLARASGGVSISVDKLVVVGGDTSEAAEALQLIRTRDIPADRYNVFFLPKEIGELGRIEAALSPSHGTPERDYHLDVFKPCIGMGCSKASQ